MNLPRSQSRRNGFQSGRAIKHWKVFPTGTPRRTDIDSTSILRRFVKEQIWTNFHVISTYFLDVILLIEKSTSFPRNFFDVISLVEKSTLFWRTFFNVFSMVEKSRLFPHTFFDVIAMSKNSCCFHVLFSRYFWWSKNPPCLHVLFST